MRKLAILSIMFLSLFGETYVHATSPVLAYTLQKQNINSVSELMSQEPRSQSLKFGGDVCAMPTILVSHNMEVVKDETGVYVVVFYGDLYTVTCIEGEYYGIQVLMDYSTGEVLGASKNFHYEVIGDEEMMVHVYDDGIVMTGETVQIIQVY